jgi:hypothetical protein
MDTPPELEESAKRLVLDLVADMRSLGILRITKDFNVSESAEVEVWFTDPIEGRVRFTITEGTE